ncbi:metallophosphoesterase family protein [Bacillus litorisediminis]|uniref:metallophosphoesterase family protein n=1 Tax=Bacillus litorisediminis TaxID=2922713 RepID=UPI001FAFB33F|nr:metallophosphoesterase family protein [Bacillus litorisediminis]
MERILAISDIHGCYDEFIQLLETVKYNPEYDQLILLGDYIDRGKESWKVVDKVIELVNGGAIALRGNHDDWFLAFLSDPKEYAFEYFLEGVGGFETVRSYLESKNIYGYDKGIEEIATLIRKHNTEHIGFLLNLPYYHETKDHIFVHAGFSPYYDDWRNNSEHEMTWIRDSFIDNPTHLEKTVVFGHTTCRMLHNNDNIWFSEDKIGIDGGCVFGLQLNCLEISTKGYKQYSVPKIKKSDDEIILGGVM